MSELPNETISVLATCHTLINLDDEIIGDPLEKVTLQTIDWTVTKNDSVVPKKANKNGWKIHQRFHFSSALKRMSVIAGHTKAAGDTQYIASCKGAPEILKSMVTFIII
jgi:cation-transporting ATPase 13A1